MLRRQDTVKPGDEDYQAVVDSNGDAQGETDSPLGSVLKTIGEFRRCASKAFCEHMKSLLLIKMLVLWI